MVLTDLIAPRRQGKHNGTRTRRSLSAQIGIWPSTSAEPMNRATAIDIEQTDDALTATFVQGLSIGSFLQYIEADRKSWTLKIRAGARKGYLHFHDGALIDAETGTMTGEPAALRILAWDDIKIVVMGECRDRKPVITHSNFHLIMEASRLKDEGLLDEESQRAVEKAIQHAEAHHHREAMDILAQQLQKIPGTVWHGCGTPAAWGEWTPSSRP